VSTKLGGTTETVVPEKAVGLYSDSPAVNIYPGGSKGDSAFEVGGEMGGFALYTGTNFPNLTHDSLELLNPSGKVIADFSY
jgi:hypothetical protein